MSNQRGNRTGAIAHSTPIAKAARAMTVQLWNHSSVKYAREFITGRPARAMTVQRWNRAGGAGGSYATGLTLVELMVVLVIIGILGAVAVPTYQQHILKARRTEAKTALLRLAANQERHYLQNNTYTDDLAALGFVAGVSDSGLYTLSVPEADASNYQAVAVPTPGGGFSGVNMSSDTACARFSIDARGRRDAFPDPDGACW